MSCMLQSFESQVKLVILRINSVNLLTFRSKNVIYDTDDDNEDQFANFSQAVGKDNAQEKSENLILDIVKDCDGTLASLDDAVAKVNYVDKKSRNRRPWNADLMIGSKFPIKIAAYIYVSVSKSPSSHFN